MTKNEAIAALKALYRVANASDSDHGVADWTKPQMSGAFCRALDTAFRELKDAGVIDSDEHQAIYDTL